MIEMVCKDEQSVFCLSTELIDSSEVFKAMFKLPTQEAHSSKVEVNDFTSAEMQALVDILNDKERPAGFDEDVELIEGVMLAADKYLLKKAKTICQVHLAR